MVTTWMGDSGTASSVGIATELLAGRSGDRIPVGGEIFRTCPDRTWGPPSLPYSGYRVFPGGKVRPGCDADPSPHSSAVDKKEYSYTSTPPMGHTARTEPQCLYRGALLDLYPFPGVKSGRGVTQSPHRLLVPWSRKSTAICIPPLRAVRPVQSLSACTTVKFTFFTFARRNHKARYIYVRSLLTCMFALSVVSLHFWEQFITCGVYSPDNTVPG